MANARKTSIHHQIMMRRASRSEYNDGLLRNNQRHENRLLLELEQWDKAQRTVAKGLDKESQWFKQTSATNYNGQRTVQRKNSNTDFNSEGGQGRFIPDYQYRGRNSVVSQPGISEEQGSQDQQDGRPAADASENGVEKAPAEPTDSSKSHRKHSKHSSSKHGDHKKSHRKSHRHGGERESRDRESEKREPDKPKVGGDTSSSAEKKTPKTGAEPSAVSSKQNHSSQSANDKPPSSKTSSKTSRKHAGDDSALTITTTTTTTTTSTNTNTITTTTTTTEPSTTTTTTTTTAQSAPNDTKPESASKTSARSNSLSQNVHDPGDVIVSPRQLKDLGWDGRRRYTNVWDNLSAPKHASQVRSVRSRLQREFTQVPAGNNMASKGFASARRPGHASGLS